MPLWSTRPTPPLPPFHPRGWRRRRPCRRWPHSRPSPRRFGRNGDTMSTATAALLNWADQQGPETAERVAQALRVARWAHRDQRRRNGDPYIEHPVAVAVILAGNGADADTVVTALLHDVLDEPMHLPLERVRGEFGDAVGNLLAAFTQLDTAPT